tara:strand:+ start:335 stop:697 length:363 start_codon:yes stop_codon:yes gene_type:complete
VIKGPWKRAKVVTPQETDRLTEDMNFIDEVAESIMIPTIHNLAENGVDIKEEDFLSEVGFLNELIKSIMFRIMGYQHPMSDLVSTVMKVETENPLTTYSKFDHDIVKKVVDRMFEEDDPA